MSDRLALSFMGDAADMPWVTADRILLRDYLFALVNAGLGDITCHLSLRTGENERGWQWVSELLCAAEWLGVDVAYCTGSYSFVDDGYACGDDQLRGFLDCHLNDHGLLEDTAAAQNYLTHYRRCLHRGLQMESLDGAIAIPIWEDRGAAALKRVLARAAGDLCP